VGNVAAGREKVSYVLLGGGVRNAAHKDRVFSPLSPCPALTLHVVVCAGHLGHQLRGARLLRGKVDAERVLTRRGAEHEHGRIIVAIATI
jgi:hypothetical protein